MNNENFYYKNTYNHGAIGAIVICVLVAAMAFFAHYPVIGLVALVIGIFICIGIVFRNLKERSDFNTLAMQCGLENVIHDRRMVLYEHARRADDPISPGVVDCHEILDIERQIEKEYPGYKSPLIDKDGIYFASNPAINSDNVTEEIVHEQLRKQLD